MNMMNRQPPRSGQSANKPTANRPAATPQRPVAPTMRSGVPLTRPVQPAAPVGRPQASANARTQASPAIRPTPPQPLSPKALSAKADELFMVMRQLCELLTKENAALKRYRADDVKALTERKEQLANLYHAHMAAVSRDPAALKSLDTSKRTTLVQMAARLADLMRDNASMLRANIRSIDTFFQAVTDAVREREEKKSASYSRAGILNGYASVKRNLAVSYNRTT
jgi:hypothetical protein